MKRNEGKGKANGISGIPLAGTMSQMEGQSVEPNRNEPDNAFKLDDSGENYARDYFDDESDRLGDLEEGFVVNKADQSWSSGLQDEENADENAVDADDNEGLLPETQPLHLDQDSRFGADDGETVLRPDNLDDNAA